jgi:hypothetical protein
MDGAALDRAELSGLQEGGQEWEKAGHKHPGEKLVISVEEGDGPQRPWSSMTLRPSSRGGPTWPKVAL